MTRKIIGIDPGTTVMGYAIIEVANQKITIETVGVVRLHKYSDHYEKLQKIFEKVSALIVAYQPKEMAIEAPFYAQNVQSMLKLGRAQGVAIAAAMVNGLSVEEYQPRKIKQSITGNGNALYIFFNSRFHNFFYRTVVAEMNNFGSFALHDPAHYINGSIMSVKKTGSCNDSYFIGRCVTHIFHKVQI